MEGNIFKEETFHRWRWGEADITMNCDYVSYYVK